MLMLNKSIISEWQHAFMVLYVVQSSTDDSERKLH